MKILSWNVNGIRSVYKKGFLDLIEKENPDILCLQEIKADKLEIEKLQVPEGYNLYINPAKKKGYSGVAVYTKIIPKKIEIKLNHERFDTEGRILSLEFENFILINLYLPHGGRKKENLSYKLESYKSIFSCLKNINHKQTILLGDFNIAHDNIDLERPRDNKDNIMFTKEERERIDNLISLGFIDTFRKMNPTSSKYTWWPYMNNLRERNIGWRIDYAFVSEKLNVKRAFILTEIKGSDHCPIGIEI